MDEKQHEEMSSEDAEAEKEKLHDLDVPEEEVENVKGGGLDFGGHDEH
jgi:hypothetical protein